MIKGGWQEEEEEEEEEEEGDGRGRGRRGVMVGVIEKVGGDGEGW